MNKPTSSHIVVGQVNRTYGLNGWHHVTSYTEQPSNLFTYPLFDQYLNPIKVLAHKPHGKKHVALFDHQAPESLVNALLYTPLDALPDLPTDQFYYHQLIGLSVIKDDGTHLGEVTDVYSNGSEDILICQNGKHHFELPIRAELNQIKLTEALIQLTTDANAFL